MLAKGGGVGGFSPTQRMCVAKFGTNAAPDNRYRIFSRYVGGGGGCVRNVVTEGYQKRECELCITRTGPK